MIKAWHFTRITLRDGSPLPADGETLVHEGELVMCESGLHASKRIIDALVYAPGHIIHRVECGGEILQLDDKLVCTERTILWRIDGDEVLRKFARLCALDVIHLWDAPQIVIDYLKTGDESKRRAARDAAWDAAWATAGSGAGSAAWAVAGDARDAAWAAQNKRLTRMVNRRRQ